MKWCALGAVDAAVGNQKYQDNSEAVQLLAAELPARWKQLRCHHASYVANYSNCTSQAHVVALFDQTIAALEAKLAALDAAFTKFKATLNVAINSSEVCSNEPILLDGVRAVGAGAADPDRHRWLDRSTWRSADLLRAVSGHHVAEPACELT